MHDPKINNFFHLCSSEQIYRKKKNVLFNFHNIFFSNIYYICLSLPKGYAFIHLWRVRGGGLDEPRLARGGSNEPLCEALITFQLMSLKHYRKDTKKKQIKKHLTKINLNIINKKCECP